MVPLADMLNHSRPRETSWEFHDAYDAFIITSVIPIGTHCQVRRNSRFRCMTAMVSSATIDIYLIMDLLCIEI